MNRLYFTKTIIAIACLMLFAATNSNAQTATWRGDSSDVFLDQDNWEGDSVHTDAYGKVTLTIDKNEGGFDPVVTETPTVYAGLNVLSGNTLYITGGDLRPNDPIFIATDAEIVIDGGGLNVRESNPSPIDSGTITLLDGTFNYKNTFTLATAATDKFTFNCWGGTATLDMLKVGAGDVTINFKAGATATFADSAMVDSLLTNGTITVAENAELVVADDNSSIEAVAKPEAVLMHSYTFDVADTAIDVVGGANGTLIGGTVVNGAYVAATNGDFIELPAGDIAINTYAGVSVEAYIKTADVPTNSMLWYLGGSTSAGVVGDGGLGANGMFVAPDHWNGPATRGAISCGNTSAPWDAETAITTTSSENGTYHIVLTIKDELKLYVNGTLISSEPLASNNSIDSLSNDFAWICRGGYSNDATCLATVYEFNIYQNELMSYEVAEKANDALYVQVGYFTLQKDMDATATTVENDPIIQMLEEDPNIDLTVILSNGSDTADLSGYDVVIAQESFGSGADVFKSTGALNIGVIDKPFIVNKSYAFTANKFLASTDAGGGKEQEGEDYYWLKVNKKDNDLFKGFTFIGDSIPMFKTVANDDGVTDSPDRLKALNYVQSVYVSNDTSLLAQPCRLKSGYEAVTISVSEMFAGDTVGSIELKADMITFGANFGAICGDGGNNMTSEHITMWRNAVYKLGSLEVPETLIEVGPFPSEYSIIYITDSERGDEMPVVDWLGAQGFNVDVMDWTGTNWTSVTSPEDTLAKINTYDLAICGRSPGSGDITDGKAYWNDSITIPLVDLSAYHLRSNKLGWINSTSASTITDGDTTFAAVDGTDELLSNIVTIGDTLMSWSYTPDAEVAVSSLKDSIADARIIAAVDGYLSLAIWDTVGKAFYAGGSDTVRAVRIGMPLGYDGSDIAWNNYLCLTSDGQQLFYNVLCQLFDISLNDVVVFSNDASLSSLTVSDGTLDPAFNADSLTYSVEAAVSGITVSAEASDENAVVSGTGDIAHDETAKVAVVAQTGKKVTYKVTFTSTLGAEALLSDLTVDGTSIVGFKSDSLDYDVEIAGTATSVVIGATATDANAGLEGTGTIAISGDTTLSVVVTAENGVASETYTVNITLGTGFESGLVTDIHVYPNPAKNSITVANVTNAEVSIYSLNGVLLQSAIVSEDNSKLDVSDLTAGMYILKVQENDNVVNFRFVKE